VTLICEKIVDDCDRKRSELFYKYSRKKDHTLSLSCEQRKLMKGVGQINSIKTNVLKGVGEI